VIDFGLAAVPGMTTTGLSGQVAVGTPAFMAPEQLAGERVTAAADMWSWAVTIAFTGTGELPFKGESLTATAYAILHSEPSVGRLPEPLGSLVHRCLSKDPAMRPPARGALSELAAAGARLAGPLPPKAPAVPAGEGAPPAPRAPAAVLEPRQGSDDGLAGPGPATTQQPARHGSGRAGRRWRAAAVLTSILLVAGVGIALVVVRPGASAERLTGGNARPGEQPGPSQQPGISPPLSAAAAIRAEAVTWIVRQVSRAEVVACDSQVCTDLIHSGFPSLNLWPLGPQSNDPLGSALVVATPAVRAQYGRRLASVYAPLVIASFGSGNARIDIRLVYPGGAKSYHAAARPALRARKAADAQLLTNSHIRLSATARTQLLSGDIDPRLPLLIVTMAHAHRVHIVDFGGWSPGGGPASLLRWVDLATPGRAAHFTTAAYLRWIRSFIHVQRAEYRPAWSREITLRPGQPVFRIEYYAPSPLR